MRHFITFRENLQTASGLSILMHGVSSLPDATSYDIRQFTVLSVVEDLDYTLDIYSAQMR